MATPTQLTEGMAKEIRDVYRVLQHIDEEIRARRSDKIYTGEMSDPQFFQLRGAYLLLRQYSGLFVERLEQLWRKLGVWSNRHPGIPLSFEKSITGEKIKLKKMFASNNELTTEQQRSGYVDEEWVDLGNRFENFFEIVDSLLHHGTIFSRRMAWYEDEWQLQGSTPRETQVMAIVSEEKDASSLLRSVLTDLVQELNLAKDARVDELELRNSYLKRRAVVAGGLELLNQGSMPAGPRVDEYDPDIKTTRDFPDLRTETKIA